MNIQENIISRKPPKSPTSSPGRADKLSSNHESCSKVLFTNSNHPADVPSIRTAKRSPTRTGIMSRLAKSPYRIQRLNNNVLPSENVSSANAQVMIILYWSHSTSVLSGDCSVQSHQWWSRNRVDGCLSSNRNAAFVSEPRSIAVELISIPTTPTSTNSQKQELSRSSGKQDWICVDLYVRYSIWNESLDYSVWFRVRYLCLK